MENTQIEYPKVGKLYYHYKGGTYEVITLAKHTETNEVMVVYKSIEFGTISARPMDNFFGKVTTFQNGGATETIRFVR